MKINLSKIGFFAFAILLSFQVFAQNKQERTVNSFTKIKIQSAIKAYIRQGNTNSVTIETNSDKLDKIVTEVFGNELTIRRENGNWFSDWNDAKVVAYITIKDFQGLDVSGASNVKGETPFKANGAFELELSGASKLEIEISATKLNIDLSGASNADVKLNTENLKVDLSGASHINIEGKADHQNIDASGASGFSGYDLASKKVYAEGSGASHIEISVSEEIKADLSGASSLRYKGNPVKSETNASGGSSVHKN